MRIYYLAYAPELKRAGIKKICPSARNIGTILLKDYGLEFREYLNIQPEEGSDVPAVVWEMTSEDESNLYKTYSKTYDKKKLWFELNGWIEEGLIYVMKREAFKKHPPTEAYFDRCFDFYDSADFDCMPLIKALNDAIVEKRIKDEEASKKYLVYPSSPTNISSSDNPKLNISEVAVGSMLMHSTYGEGTVVKIDEPYITIRFQDGVEKKFNFSMAIEKGTLRII